MDIIERYLGRGSHSADFTIPGAAAHYPPDLELEPTHLDITVEFDVPACRAVGTVVTTIVANRKGARSIVLNACDFEDLSVTDQDGWQLFHRYDGRRLEVFWPEAFEMAERRDLNISYTIEHPVSGLLFSSPDDEYPDQAYWVATDHETERARYWLPCVDLPAVRTTLAFHLTAPESFTILANGLLTGEDAHANGTKTAHWELDYPCPSYLICMAAGEFVAFEDKPHEGRPIAYFGAKGRATPEDLERSFGRTGEIMAWLETRLGVPFPFPKYYQFALPQFGGAMENISLVSWDDIFITDETLHREFGHVVDIVNVHEMAHSYFGDAVVIRDFAHAWLKESWATYIETCWYEDRHGPDEGRYDYFLNSRAYMDEADKNYARPIVTRVFNSSWDMYDRHLYPGGACRLHMLRKQLGDEVFWPAVTEYLETFSREVVETEDFRRLMERRSGRSLVRFFNQWFYGRGYPKLKLAFAHDKEQGQGTITLEQTQVSSRKKDDKKALPVFSFPLTIAFEEPGGAWVRKTFEVENAKHTFLIAMAEAPRQIRVDPDGASLFRLDFNPGDEMLRRAVTAAPDVIGRIFAAEELAMTAKPSNLTAVLEAFRAEKFWGARRAMVDAVARSKAPAAIGVLIAMMSGETDPRVLSTLAERCGEYRDPRIAKALIALIGRTEEYFPQSFALASLGRQRGVAHLDTLTAAAERNDYRGIVRSGGLRGLGQTRSEEAYGILLSRVGYGRERSDSAPTAVVALASCAAHQEKRLKDRAVELLCDQLRDPRERVRMAAAGALGGLKAAQAVPALEAAIKRLPEQVHARIRRMIMGISGDANGKRETTALKETMEKLEDRLRKMADRIDKLEAAGELNQPEE